MCRGNGNICILVISQGRCSSCNDNGEQSSPFPIRIKAQGEEKSKLAMATLTWVCHSERPLLVDELCHALAVETGAADFDSENIPLIGTLLDCCQGLITVDKEASTVRLIHFTVQEYLCTHPDLPSKPQSILAETCLTYLNSQQIKNLPSHPLPDYQKNLFLAYSSIYWGAHANKDLSDHARTLALRLLDQYEDHISATSLLQQELHPRYIGHIGTSPLFSGLHCASYFGIVELVTTLINTKGYQINQRDSAGGTPLSWAVRNRHEGVVKLLLERDDVDPNLPGISDLTPLGWAAAIGHEGVVKLLLERENVDPNRPGMDNRTPLGCAAMMGHEGVVKLLLRVETVDPNRADKNDLTPLAWATAQGHEVVAKLLLGREDIDLNRPDKNDLTPLTHAAAMGHEGVVKLLLRRKDVDPNSLDKNNRTPLGQAAAMGHEGVAKLLLELENVDPNRPDEKDLTPLAWAASRGHEGVVKLLLRRENVDSNRPDQSDRTPLTWAANQGHEGVVQLLLEQESVDPNRVDKDGQPPLVRAVNQGHEGVVKLLLERENVDPNRPDKNDLTPLWYAAG